MSRLFAGGFALAVSAALAAAADDKTEPKEKPAVTTWEREVSGIDLKFEVGKDTVKIFVFAGENGAIVTSKTAEKDGVVKATVTAVEEKGNFPSKPKVGLEWSFKWAVKGDTAVLSDLKGTGLDEAKPILEGEYKQKKPKK
ncbi:MAG: hypothetical protein C0501_26620 [Isosphaera sp.]|nr:hypothetical protein [Isosphaera sp.]